MESGNKVVGLVVVVFLVGAVGFFYRSNIEKLLKHGSSSAPASTHDSSLAVGGRVVVEAFGKPYIAEDALNNKLQQMLQSSPVTRSMDPATLPAPAKINFLKDWINFLLIKDIWGKQHNVENDSAFQKRYNDAVEALKDSLIIDAFVQDLKKTISVSDDDVVAEYQSNKDRYLKTPGGASCSVVEFADAALARSLQHQAESVSSMDEFKSLVDGMGAGKLTSLGFVDGRGAASQAGLSKLPAEVRRVVLGKHAESVVLVPVKDSYFVIFMTEKKAPQFHELEQISSQVKAMLEETKQREALENALADLRDSANLVIKTDVLGVSAENQPRVLSKEELAAALQADDVALSDEDMVMDDAS